MKTDKWFYELFLSQPGMLAELVAGIEADWEFTYSAPVIKEKSFELDGVFTPVLADPMVPLVLVEAQMQTDAYFYHRYFSEVFLAGTLDSKESRSKFRVRIALQRFIGSTGHPALPQ